MYSKQQIAGFECNCIESKKGELRAVTIMIGPPDKAGYRSKDGPLAKAKRQEAKQAVIAATGLPRAKVRVASRFTSLIATDSGIARRDDEGNTTGFYPGI